MSRSDVEAGEKLWVDAMNSGDAAGVAALYAEDGRLMAPNAETLTGRASIEAMCKEFVAIDAKLSFELLTVHEAGDLSVAVGTYELDMRPPGVDPQHDSGKFVEVWKKQADGEWRIVDDIFNSSLPAPTG